MRKLPKTSDCSRLFSAQQPRRAFTLIELLVVLAIILLLASMLSGAVRTVLSVAQTAKCASNLRQIGMAIIGFTSDNNGNTPAIQTSNNAATGLWGSSMTTWSENDNTIPIWGTWPGSIREYADLDMKYTSSVFLCPNGNWNHREYRVINGAGIPDEWALYLSNYGMNLPISLTVTGALSASSLAISRIPKAASTIMVSEIWGVRTNSTATSIGTVSGKLDPTLSGYLAPPRRIPTIPTDASVQACNQAWRLSHRGQANIVCFDGHVESAGPAQTGTYLADRRLDVSQPSRWLGTY